MSSAQHFTLPPIHLYTTNQLKDYCRCLLYTIIFHRSLGAVKPVDIQSDTFDTITYVKHYDGDTNDIDAKVEQSVQSFADRVNKLHQTQQLLAGANVSGRRTQSLPQSTMGAGGGYINCTISLGFFTKPASTSAATTPTSQSTRSPSWLSSVSSIVSSVVHTVSATGGTGSNAEQRQFWERWTIPIIYVTQPTAPLPSSIHTVQADVRAAMMQVTVQCGASKHLPLVNTKASNVPLFYPFEISYNCEGSKT